MGVIFAIGGGGIGYKGSPIETTIIDEEIIKASNKNHPRLLFIPTASGDSEGYIKLVKNHFGNSLGCKIDALCLFNEALKKDEIKDKVISSDIIYVGGGDTQKMLEKWKEKKIEEYLVEAYKRGIILSGISAGAMCWFSSIYIENEKDKTFKIVTNNRLNLISGIFIPHYSEEKKYKINNIEGLNIFAVSNNCAIKIIDKKKFEIIKSQQNAKAFLIDKRKKVKELKEKIFFNI